MQSKWLLSLSLLWALSSPAQVTLHQGPGQIEIKIGGKPFSTFYFGGDAPKPYLHPLRAADGTIVTRRFPMENVAGERQDHPHHRGLWFTHGDVNGYDFWANEPGQKVARKGVVTLHGIKSASGNQIHAVFDWQTPEGALLLTEDRKMVFHGSGDNRIIDFDVTFTADSQEVTFGDTKEGMFAIRLATPLEEPHARAEGIPRTGKIVAADGRGGEKDVWGTRSPWLDYSGMIDGKKLGVAILDHPQNPKHPTYWHVRSYGLFAANIFGEHDFHRDESRNGSVKLAPGESLRFRYRVVIHPGDTREAAIAELYRSYAAGKDPSKTE